MQDRTGPEGEDQEGKIQLADNRFNGQAEQIVVGGVTGRNGHNQMPQGLPACKCKCILEQAGNTLPRSTYHCSPLHLRPEAPVAVSRIWCGQPMHAGGVVERNRPRPLCLFQAGSPRGSRLGPTTLQCSCGRCCKLHLTEVVNRQL